MEPGMFDIPDSLTPPRVLVNLCGREISKPALWPIKTVRMWLNWIEHLATDQAVPGSNPGIRTSLYREVGDNSQLPFL
jgi:hypothetical protein